jgi:hypothetical protein
MNIADILKARAQERTELENEHCKLSDEIIEVEVYSDDFIKIRAADVIEEIMNSKEFEVFILREILGSGNSNKLNQFIDAAIYKVASRAREERYAKS